MTEIIVEDGSVVANANSYVSVSGVDVYATDYGYSDWTSATDTVKTQSLLRGMRYIEGLNFKGTRANDDQKLAFPRYDLYDRDGYLIDDDVIPDRLIDAVCEAAICSLPDTDVDLQPTRSRDDYRKKVDVAGVVVEEWYASANGLRNNSRVIQDLLVGLVKNNVIVDVERG